MRCNVITLFPGIIRAGLDEGVLRRAQEKRLLDARIHDLRDFTNDRHRTADDQPYGGGAGMVLKPEPLFRAVDHLRESGEPLRLILTSPQGRIFTQETAREFSREDRRLVFLCGRYEGVDERVLEGLEAEEFSIGDYVLTGGELPALVMIDAAARWVPGVVGDPQSVEEDSFSDGRLNHPQYTRPSVFRGMAVPEELNSGNHGVIQRWRRRQSLLSTMGKRPDLFIKMELTDEDRDILESLKNEIISRLSGTRQESIQAHPVSGGGRIA